MFSDKFGTLLPKLRVGLPVEMLERIAMNQTRLRTPGLGLDAHGVALGSKGLVLLPSIDRLVAFLAAYTEQRSLEDVLSSLHIAVVQSSLKHREFLLEIAAESSSRMDAFAETARLVGGTIFTGTSRHFVQYRDRAAPFGYDAPQLLNEQAAYLLYHASFSQAFNTEREVDLKGLLLRLMPRVDPKTRNEPGPRWIVAERGLGPALVHYLVRWEVPAEVALAEWAPESSFETEPTQRYLFHVPEVPLRMMPMLSATPGLTLCVPVAPGVAVESGYRHPISLRAVPLFEPSGMVFFRGEREPLVLDRMPATADLRAFARVTISQREVPITKVGPKAVPTLGVPLRVLHSVGASKQPTATWISQSDFPLLRKLAYALPPRVLQTTQVALSDRGVFLRSVGGVDGIPLGTFFYELHPGFYVPSGHELVPAFSPRVLASALTLSAGKIAFFGTDAVAYLIDESAFASLERMLIDAPSWNVLEAQSIVSFLDEKVPELSIEGLGLFPMRRAGRVPEGATVTEKADGKD